MRRQRPFVWEFRLPAMAGGLVGLAWVDPAGFCAAVFSMFGAARIVRDAGGMVPLVDRQMRGVGLSRVNCGARGDIAVLSVGGVGGENFGNQAGAILLGGTAVLMCQEGLCMPRLADVPALAAWQV